MRPMLEIVSLKRLNDVYCISPRTWIARIAVGTNVVSCDSANQFLQLVFIARLLALANDSGHGRGRLGTTVTRGQEGRFKRGDLG